MTNPDETATMVRTIQIEKFIAKLNLKLSQSFIVKYTDKTDSLSQVQDTEGILKKSIQGEQHLKLTNKCILNQESVLIIEIHRKYPLRRKILSPGRISKHDPLCKVNIKFDSLWDYLVSETQKGSKSNFEVGLPNRIPGLQLWIVAETYDLNVLDRRIKSAIEKLKDFRPIMDRLGSTTDVSRMVIEFGKAISGLEPIAKSVFSCIDVIYQHFKTQEESHREVKNMAESIRILAGQLARLKDIPKSKKLCITIGEFHGMMEEVLDLIEKWLKSWQTKHILVVAHMDKAIELRKKLDAFAGNFDRDLLIEIRAEQAIIANGVEKIINQVLYK